MLTFSYRLNKNLALSTPQNIPLDFNFYKRDREGGQASNHLATAMVLPHYPYLLPINGPCNMLPPSFHGDQHPQQHRGLEDKHVVIWELLGLLFHFLMTMGFWRVRGSILSAQLWVSTKVWVSADAISTVTKLTFGHSRPFHGQ